MPVQHFSFYSLQFGVSFTEFDTNWDETLDKKCTNSTGRATAPQQNTTTTIVTDRLGPHHGETVRLRGQQMYGVEVKGLTFVPPKILLVIVHVISRELQLSFKCCIWVFLALQPLSPWPCQTRLHAFSCWLKTCHLQQYFFLMVTNSQNMTNASANSCRGTKKHPVTLMANMIMAKWNDQWE